MDPGDLRTGGPVFLDWWMTNDSPFPTENEFESHVYVDGIFVNSWVSTQSPPFQTFGISDWNGINDKIRLDKGEHVFKLVIDALDHVHETDETDNVFERSFTWGGDPIESEAVGLKGVNLVIEPASGRSEPLLAAAQEGASTSGPLTVDESTFITWGVGNAGLSSTDSSVDVHVAIDGIVVDRRVVDGLTALSGASLVDWSELGNLVAITPGVHTLSVVVDPGNLIDETDESDNTYSSEFNWGTGPAVPPDPQAEVSPVQPPVYEELTLPNLETYLPADWDAALVIRDTTSSPQTVGRSGYVQAFTAGVVDYAITNDSSIENPTDFTTTLFLDGSEIDESGFVGGTAGGVWLVDVSVPADRLTPGIHTLELRIDSNHDVTEADESDNVVILEFEALAGAPPDPPPPASYSDADLTSMLAILPELLLQTANSDGLGTETTDWVAEITRVADAAYFLATGTVLADERIDISFLSRDTYESTNLATCLENQDTMKSAEYATSLADCRSTISSSAGLTWTGSGKVSVSVDSSTTPADALVTLLHELGHARQNLLAPPTRFTVQSVARSALLEAQAQVFSATGIRHIEEFLGMNITQYPDLAVIRDDIGGLVDFHLKEAAANEVHSLGYQLMWIGALQNVGGLGLADELRTEGILSAATSLAFYDYLLTIDGQDPVTWVNSRLDAGSSFIDEYRQIALARTAAGLSAEDEAHPHLRDVAFLAP